MLARYQRTEALDILRTMKADLLLLLESLTDKDDELSKLEACDDSCEKAQLTSTERRLRIESLAYDIISGKDIQFLDDVQRLTKDYFNDPVPERAVCNG